MIAESEELLVEKIERWRKGLETGGPKSKFWKDEDNEMRDWCRTSKELRQISLWSV